MHTSLCILHIKSLVSNAVNRDEKHLDRHGRKAFEHALAIQRVARDVIVFSFNHEDHADGVRIRMLGLDGTEGGAGLRPGRAVVKENIVFLRRRIFLPPARSK